MTTPHCTGLQNRVVCQSASRLHFHCASEFVHSFTRRHVRLLGPCFKTGQVGGHLVHRDDTKRQIKHTSRRPHQLAQALASTDNSRYTILRTAGIQTISRYTSVSRRLVTASSPVYRRAHKEQPIALGAHVGEMQPTTNSARTPQSCESQCTRPPVASL
jgi:hypothetical protein